MKNREFEDTKGAIRIGKSMKNREFEDTKGAIRIRKSMKNREFEDTKGADLRILIAPLISSNSLFFIDLRILIAPLISSNSSLISTFLLQTFEYDRI
jgi:hypothetical protein